MSEPSPGRPLILQKLKRPELKCTQRAVGIAEAAARVLVSIRGRVGRDGQARVAAGAAGEVERRVLAAGAAREALALDAVDALGELAGLHAADGVGLDGGGEVARPAPGGRRSPRRPSSPRAAVPRPSRSRSSACSSAARWARCSRSARASVAARSSLDSVIAGMLSTSATATAASRMAAGEGGRACGRAAGSCGQEAGDLEQAGQRLVAILACPRSPAALYQRPRGGGQVSCRAERSASSRSGCRWRYPSSRVRRGTAFWPSSTSLDIPP